MYNSMWPLLMICYLTLFTYASENNENTTECSQEEWEQNAKEWIGIENFVMRSDYFKCEINSIKSAISTLVNDGHKKVLDCGCGAGRWSRLAYNAGAETVVALDLAENFIKLAKEMTSNTESQHIQYGTHDFNERLPKIYHNTFDVVINVHLVCHAQSIEMLRNFYSNMRDAFDKTNGGKIFTLLENHYLSPFEYHRHIKYGWIKQIHPDDIYYFYKNGVLRNGTKIVLNGYFPNEYTITTWSWTKEIHESVLKELGYTNIKWIEFDCNDENNDDLNLHRLYQDDAVREFVMDYYHYPTNIAFIADYTYS